MGVLMTDVPSLLDDDGHLRCHTDWTPDIAQTLADTIAVTLTDRHYEILMLVRTFFEEYHHAPTTRPLINYLKKDRKSVV